MPTLHQVDALNFHIESSSFIHHARQCRSPLVFLDTEFPGNIYQSPKPHAQLSPSERYALLKLNADAIRPIQAGITLTDGTSSSSSASANTWQFDLRDFDPRWHPHAPDSIALLSSSGIDLERNARLGIHSTWLAKLLIDAGLVGRGSSATWVSFHGCYDLAILMKALVELMGRVPLPVVLPGRMEEFMGMMRWMLGGGNIYDVKCVMRSCQGMYGGLERVAERLNVERAMGKAHQAGSDSLLTCQVFLKMKKLFFSRGGEEEEMPAEGVIFGLNG